MQRSTGKYFPLGFDRCASGDMHWNVIFALGGGRLFVARSGLGDGMSMLGYRCTAVIRFAVFCFELFMSGPKCGYPSL